MHALEHDCTAVLSFDFGRQGIGCVASLKSMPLASAVGM